MVALANRAARSLISTMVLCYVLIARFLKQTFRDTATVAISGIAYQPFQINEMRSSGIINNGQIILLLNQLVVHSARYGYDCRLLIIQNSMARFDNYTQPMRKMAMTSLPPDQNVVDYAQCDNLYAIMRPVDAA